MHDTFHSAFDLHQRLDEARRPDQTPAERADRVERGMYRRAGGEALKIREFLREVLKRPGEEVLIPKALIEALLSELGPEPTHEPRDLTDLAPITSFKDFHRRYGCSDLWHLKNSVSYHVYTHCPSCNEYHPEPWKLQKIPGDGSGTP